MLTNKLPGAAAKSVDLKREMKFEGAGHCSSELTASCRGWLGLSIVLVSQYETHHDSVEQNTGQQHRNDHEVAHRLAVEILTPNVAAMRRQVQPLVRIR